MSKKGFTIMKLYTFCAALAFSTMLSGCKTTDTIQASQSFNLNEGTDVTLTPPESFLIAPDFLGFQNTVQRSKIEVSELILPFSTIEDTFSKQTLAPLKLELLSKESITYNAKPAYLFTLRQPVNGIYFKKLWLLYGDEISTVRLTASFQRVSRIVYNQH
ncbi:hypothetical protein [Pseudoalteromonas sp. GB56]